LTQVLWRVWRVFIERSLKKMNAAIATESSTVVRNQCEHLTALLADRANSAKQELPLEN